MKIHKFDLLVGLYVALLCMSEFTGQKTFPLFAFGPLQLNASVAIFLLPLIFTINDVIVEVYGKERAKSVVRVGLAMIFILMLFSIIATRLPPSNRFAPEEEAYDIIIGRSIRISAASLLAFSFAEFLDVLLFSKLRERLKAKGLWFRNNLSNFISQLADTTLFMFLAFYAVDKGTFENMTFLGSLILPYWLLKCFMSVIETPLVYFGVRWLKKDEKY